MHEHYWGVEMQLRELPYIRDTKEFNLAQMLLLLPANDCPAVVIYSLELRYDQALISQKRPFAAADL